MVPSPCPCPISSFSRWISRSPRLRSSGGRSTMPMPSGAQPPLLNLGLEWREYGVPRRELLLERW